SEPMRLDRRRLAREQLQPVQRGMTGQVDEDVYPQLAQASRRPIVRDPAQRNPMIGVLAEAPRDGVLTAAGAESGDLEAVLVVMLQDRRGEERDRVLAKVARDVAYPEPAIGIPGVGVLRPFRRVLRFDPGAGGAMLGVDLRSRKPRQIVE